MKKLEIGDLCLSRYRVDGRVYKITGVYQDGWKVDVEYHGMIVAGKIVEEDEMMKNKLIGYDFQTFVKIEMQEVEVFSATYHEQGSDLQTRLFMDQEEADKWLWSKLSDQPYSLGAHSAMLELGDDFDRTSHILKMPKV